MTTPSPGRSGPRGSAFRFVALAPFVVVVVVFALVPLAMVVRMAFSDVSVSGGGMAFRFVGLDQLARAFGNERFGHSLVITAAFVAVTAVGSVLLGGGLAILAARAVVMRRLAMTVLVWPAIIAPVVVSVLWVLILSPQIGLWNKVSGLLGLPPQGWLGDPVGAMVSIILVDLWHWTPLVFLIVYTAMTGIDEQVLEAAQIDGAGEWQTTRHIVVPLLRPALAAALALRVVMGVKVFDEMYLLTRGGPGDSTMVVSLLIRSVVFDEVDLGYGSALSLVTVAVVCLAAAAIAIARSAAGRRKVVTR